jgi:hypothetical protein
MNQGVSMNRLMMVLLAGLLAMSVACGDDTEAGSTTPDPTPDSMPDGTPDGTPDAMPDGTPDAMPDGTPDAAPDSTPDPTPDDPCAQVDCVDGTPDDYDFSVPGSRFSSIILETDASVGADLDGDGDADNALGALLNDLGTLLGDADLNAQLAESIEEGSLSLGATWPSFADGLADSGDADIHMFALVDPDDNPATTDEYLADRESFIEGTQSPIIQFNGASVSGGALTAGPSNFNLTVPLGEIALNVTISEAEIEGNLSEDAGGIAASGVTLAGVLSLENLIDALNAFLQSGQCTCLGLEGPLIDLSLGAGPQACVGQFDDSTCADEGQDLCATIAGACILAVPVIAGQTDIDLDGDGTSDALSVFIRIEMEGTNISGVGSE